MRFTIQNPDNSSSLSSRFPGEIGLALPLYRQPGAAGVLLNKHEMIIPQHSQVGPIVDVIEIVQPAESGKIAKYLCWTALKTNRCIDSVVMAGINCKRA